MSTPKTAKDAKPGDRIWVKNSVGEVYEWKIISPELYTGSLSIDVIWGFLADDETVIGGVMIKPFSVDGSWEIGGRVLWPHDILNEDTWLTPMMCGLNLSDADKAAIQDHVRKHSAPAIVPKKRSAADARAGNEVWVIDIATNVMFEGIVWTTEPSPLGWKLEIGVGDTRYLRFENTFGINWGFPEDRPDTAKALPVDQPAPDEEKPLPPQLGNVALLIKAKGSDWVKANYPDLWDAYKAAGLEKVRSAAEKLARPGPLAGKTIQF